MKRTGSFTETLAILAQKGLRYSTVFDLGCADGHFFVEHYVRGMFQDSVPINIDANSLYEPSLKAVQDALGGDYRIAAVSDSPGTVELTTSVHPYWNSLRSSKEFYWNRVNNLTTGVKLVPAITLDGLVAELNSKPPYLIKMDVQSAEVQALRGAKWPAAGSVDSRLS